MFIGHFALGLAAKRPAPELSLATLFGAAQFADFLWPALVATGIEVVRIDPGNTAATPLDFVSYPYSHSLLALILFGAAFGAVVFFRTRSARLFSVIFALVVSHWILDVITHRPDMPLYPGGPRLGLGLWNFPTVTRAVEIAMFVGGLWVYTRTTRPADRIGLWGFWSIMAFLFVGFLAANQPPPSVTAIWSVSLILGVLTLVWSGWADAHRNVKRKT